MDNSNVVKNLIVLGTKLSKNDACTKVDSTMFKQLIDSLIYVTTTHLDLLYEVSLISRFMSCPIESHWLVAKCILRYLKETTKLGIFYKKEGSTYIMTYFDRDFIGDLDDRRSTFGFVFLLCFGAVSWSLKK